MEENIYYDINETLTHNCLFNFVCGNRSGGKTYGFKKWAIADYIKRGNQFAYVRRYESEISGKIEAFFDDVCIEFPDYEFDVNGRKFRMRPRCDPNDKAAVKASKWEVIGHCFILSKAMTYKSVPFPKVNKILFDEFLIEKGAYRYLPNEVDKFNDLYVTVARPGSDHPEVIVFFMSNAITFTNIYFLYFGIKPPANGKRFFKVKGKDILLQMVNKDGMIRRQKNTRFGKIIDGTKYAAYAFDNEFYLDDATFIERRSEAAKCVFGIVYKGFIIGVWIDYNEGLMYASDKYDPCRGIMYAVTQEDHTPDTTLVKTVNQGFYMKQFIQCYKDGDVRFENMRVKNLCYEIIRSLSMR